MTPMLVKTDLLQRQHLHHLLNRRLRVESTTTKKRAEALIPLLFMYLMHATQLIESAGHYSTLRTLVTDSTLWTLLKNSLLSAGI